MASCEIQFICDFSNRWPSFFSYIGGVNSLSIEHFSKLDHQGGLF